MSRYNPLWEEIVSRNIDEGVVSFDEIKNILGFDIDHSFLNFKKELLQYGFQSGNISIKNKLINYSKIFK